MLDGQMRPIVWVGDSKRKLTEFPRDVQRDIGFALQIAQGRSTHITAKPLRGFFQVSMRLLVITHVTLIGRFMWVNLNDTIYVLHCFQKKSKQGIKTPKKEIDLIRSRLNRAKELAQEES